MDQKRVGDLEHGAGPLWRAVPENRRGHAESRAGRDLGPFVRLCRHARQSLSARILGERRRTEVCRGCFLARVLGVPQGGRTRPSDAARVEDRHLGIVLRRTLECRGHDRQSAAEATSARLVVWLGAYQPKKKGSVCLDRIRVAGYDPPAPTETTWFYRAATYGIGGDQVDDPQARPARRGR